MIFKYLDTLSGVPECDRGRALRGCQELVSAKLQVKEPFFTPKIIMWKHCIKFICIKWRSTESEALKMFLDKFAARIIPEYMSQRDFLTCVANDAFLAQVNMPIVDLL